MPSIFTQIIAGEVPSFKIKEDDNFYAFLDVFPIKPGHTLIVPKVEIDNFFDIDPVQLSKIFSFAQPIAKAIEKSFDCNRCGISVIGLEVPHAHMHLVPINSANDLNFTKSKLALTQEEFKATQELILSNL